MIILDTNVVSEFMKPKPSSNVVHWLFSQPSESVWTTSVTVFEIQYGLNILPNGKRKRGLIHQFDQALKNDFDGRILDFNVEAAIAAAKISSKYKASGQATDIRDIQIAGITSVKDGTLATRNTKDFEAAGINLVNPWDFLPNPQI